MIKQVLTACIILFFVAEGSLCWEAKVSPLPVAAAGTVQNSIDMVGAQNISVQVMYPWSEKIDSSSWIPLDPGKHYVLMLVEINDT